MDRPCCAAPRRFARSLPLAALLALATAGLGVTPAPAQSFVRSIGVGPRGAPSGVAVDSANGGNVVVLDAGNSQVVTFSPTGSLIRTIASGGSSTLQGVAVDSANGGNVLVSIAGSDGGNVDEVDVYTATGSPVRAIGSPGTGPGQLSGPAGIAVDTANRSNVLVADQFNNRIEVFSATGAFIRTIGTAGSGDGQLNLPTGVAVDSANGGNVVVLDTGNNRVVTFSPTGSFIQAFSTGGSGTAQGIAVDPASGGNVLISVAGSDGGDIAEVDVYTATGSPDRTIGSPGAGPGQLSGPAGIAIDTANHNNVLIADQGNDRIDIFTSGVPQPVPAQGGWALLLSALLFAGAGWRGLRRSSVWG